MLKKLILIFSAVILLASFLFFLIVFRKSERQERERTKESEGEEQSLSEPRRFEDIANRSCEHGKRIIECDDCRYEAGVVKIDSSLLTSPDPQHSLIGLETVRLENPMRRLEVVGEVQPDPDKILRIRSKTTGVITSLEVGLGQRVKRGQILLEMDSNEYRELYLDFLKLDVLQKLARKNYERENRLFRKKLTTEKEFLEAQAEAERIGIDMNILAKKLMLIGLNDSEIQELKDRAQDPQPGYLPVRSPLDGVVVEREASPGEFVESNAGLITIADFSTLWVWVNLYEIDLGIIQSAYLKGGVQAEISVATYPDRIFTGQLDYLAEIMDEHTRTIKARIRLSNREGLLRTGMFVHCTLLIPSEKPTLIIPQEALLKDGHESFVFKQVGKDLFFKQAVKTGQVAANSVEVLEGLQTDDRIVLRGAFTLKSDILRAKMGAGCAD